MKDFEKIKDYTNAVLAFLVPGGIFTFLLDTESARILGVEDSYSHLHSNQAVWGIVSISVGYVLYSFWTVAFRTFSTIFRIKVLNPKDVADFKKLEHIQFTYHYDFRLYQLYGSLFVAFVAHSSFLIWTGFQTKLYFYAVAAIMAAINSMFCYFVFRDRMIKLEQPQIWKG